MSLLYDPNLSIYQFNIFFSTPLLDLKQEMKVKSTSNLSNTNEKPPLRELKSFIVRYSLFDIRYLNMFDF